MPVSSVWIVDDLPQTRAWLRRALTLAFGAPTLHDAGSLSAARRVSLEHGWPDLALIDLHLPDGHGTELIAELTRARPDAGILVPTIFDDDAYLFDAIRAGADGHLLKDQPIDALAETLRAHVGGAPPALSPSLARRILRALGGIGAPVAEPVRQYLQHRARGLSATEATALVEVDGAMLRQTLAPLRTPTNG